MTPAPDVERAREDIEVLTDAANHFQWQIDEDGVCDVGMPPDMALKVIAAIRTLTALDRPQTDGEAQTQPALQLAREALELAQPIVESDHDQAKDAGDADWEGMSYTALTAVNEAISALRADGDA